MTIASEITRINGNISDAYTAAGNKGATLPATQNSGNLATCIASIPSGGSGGNYTLLQRVKDDSNNEIGTVSGFFTDANNVEYAVVCLDAQYRNSSGVYLTSGYGVPSVDSNMASFSTNAVYECLDTATSNTTKILDFATAQSQTSSACSHCRSQTFIIGGQSYAGQLPNILELIDIYKNKTAINTADSSASAPNPILLSTDTCWSSTQGAAADGWCIYQDGNVKTVNKYQSYMVAPVLEIPNNSI